jgi:hypothetical protein
LDAPAYYAPVASPRKPTSTYIPVARASLPIYNSTYKPATAYVPRSSIVTPVESKSVYTPSPALNLAPAYIPIGSSTLTQDVSKPISSPVAQNVTLGTFNSVFTNENYSYHKPAHFSTTKTSKPTF